MTDDITADNDDKVIAENLRPLQLTSREIELVLNYGYPFPEEAALLRASKAKRGVHHVQIEADWIEMWSADIVRSAKKLRSRALLDELDALCDVLENAERHATRLRGI